jgi:hypothetical protein
MIKWAKAKPGDIHSMFAVTGWDGIARIYQITPASQTTQESLSQIQSIQFESEALAVEWYQWPKYEAPSHLVVGLVNGTVKIVNMGSGNVHDLCKVEESILNIWHYTPEQRSENYLLVVTLGQRIYLYCADVDNRVSYSNRLVKTVSLFGLVTACDYRNGAFVAGVTSEQRRMNTGNLAWNKNSSAAVTKHSVILAQNLDDLFSDGYSRNVRIFFW